MYFYMPTQGRIVCNDDMIVDLAIVGNMGVHHEEIIISDQGLPVWVCRDMHCAELSEGVMIPNDDTTIYISGSNILRIFPYATAMEYLIIVPQGCVLFDLYIRPDLAMSTNLYVLPDDAERPDPYALPNSS